MSNVVLAVVAHPDDEVLGCGGALARHAAEGDRVHILILGEGATARDPQRDPQARAVDIERLQQSARRASEILGAEPPEFAGLPDNRFDGMELLDITKRVESVAFELAPGIVYTHFVNDLNIDHRLTHHAVLAACRPMPGRSVRRLLAFEVCSSTEFSPSDAPAFRPNHFVAIDGYLQRKLEALSVYDAEMHPFPHVRSPRALEALAHLRGAQVGVVAAEAFELVREIR